MLRVRAAGADACYGVRCGCVLRGQVRVRAAGAGGVCVLRVRAEYELAITDVFHITIVWRGVSLGTSRKTLHLKVVLG